MSVKKIVRVLNKMIKNFDNSSFKKNTDGTKLSETLFSELFTASKDFEGYVTHYEFLSQFQKWQKNKRRKKKVMNGRIILH